MASQVKDVTIDMSEHEFAKPCGSPNCEAEAEWFGMSKHGVKSCPGEAYLCTKHKEMTLKWWSDKLPIIETTAGRCARCRVRVTGQVSDNLKFIRL